jgi:hypothetical protein
MAFCKVTVIALADGNLLDTYVSWQHGQFGSTFWTNLLHPDYRNLGLAKVKSSICLLVAEYPDAKIF